ncbi:MAG: 4-hydroxy-tetrahydrodipicolinate synthase [Alphaproteobacteria bacterium]|nr:4-hydroxy-tetrahydrodipicolinate synthase [Alphaproteobacteria bacterium]MCD8519829.1 4-hydroxy-tetrahydrodipicolinate synthase [Alphaproteobacteria bacterium]MCD8570333.1 4-hydroxy-tetrahydrodipicolinate synthase [Alphaproteobacteria bacterium]
MFRGSITALITPFKNGEVDWKAFDDFVEWQIQEGTHALVPCGTTGESPTLSHEEHNAIVKRCVEIANKRIPVIAGTGSNSTKEAIALITHAKADGADAALVVTPYYNKPTQEGLYAHYKAIHDAASLPILIYNIPGRSVVDMNVDTMARLAKLPNIVGVKDATGDLARPAEVIQKIGYDFCQLSGEDATTAAFLAQGGVGCISVLSNIAPRLFSEMHEAWFRGDVKAVAVIRDQLAPLAKNLFCESSPAPVKYAASILGICSEEVRLPLLPASENARALIDSAMAHAGLTQGSSPKIAHG